MAGLWRLDQPACSGRTTPAEVDGECAFRQVCGTDEGWLLYSREWVKVAVNVRTSIANHVTPVPVTAEQATRVVSRPAHQPTDRLWVTWATATLPAAPRFPQQLRVDYTRATGALQTAMVGVAGGRGERLQGRTEDMVTAQ